MNVALRNNQKQFSSSGLQTAVQFFLDRGHQVMIFLPDYILQPAKNKKVYFSSKEDLKKTADDFSIIEDLQQKKLICGVPSWEYVTNFNYRLIISLI